QQVGKDLCFRCGLKIRSAEDLVFDHKVPWMDNSAELFWDIENVGFSHPHRNLRAIRRIGTTKHSLRKVGPVGTAWCCGHQGFLPAANFCKNKSHWNGLSFYCKECDSKQYV